MKWLSRPAPFEPQRGLGRLLRAQGPAPRPGKREYLFDAVLAFVLAAPTKAVRNYSQAHLGGFYAYMDVPKATLTAFALAMLAILCFRRRFPLTVFWAMMAVLPLCPMPLLTLAVGLAISAYSAAVYSPYRHVAYALLPFACIELFVLDYANLVPGNNLDALPVTVPALVALYLYGREVRKDAAGTMAGAARKVLEKSPQQATDALLEVEAAGRAAMTELRQVMGLLTENPRDRRELTPQPGLDQIGALVKRIRATGVPIEYRVQGTPRPLPHGIDLTAYHVVQEALTNAIKHASGASVDIDVCYAPALLGLRVDDSGGVPGRTAASGNGRGLIGLRERVGVHGGTVEAGPRALGGSGGAAPGGVSQSPRIIILTTFGLDEYVYDALAAGASGFLLKDVTPEHLVGAVRLVTPGDAQD